MSAEGIYSNTIIALREQMEGHKCPDGRRSLKAFCDAYGMGRANLMTILGGHQDMSVGLFVRIMTALGKVSPDGMSSGKDIDHVSLKTWIGMEYIKIWELLVKVQIDK